MSDRYNEKNTMNKEAAGREKYLNWISSKTECTHVCFTADRWCSFDCIFLSAGTQMICELKGRNYDANFFQKFGVEIDAQKARGVYRMANRLGAKPIIITCTCDDQFIISDLTLATKNDLTTKWVQNNDNDHASEWCELINLSGCTIN